MKITVVGTGYVGLSLAVLLSGKNEVVALDVLTEKVEKINSGISPIVDKEIEEYLKNGKLNLTATTDDYLAIKDADYVVISTPTNYDEKLNFFDTSSVESVIEKTLKINPKAVMVVKSTVPVGFTEGICEKFKTDRVLFSPEFLREGRALYDNLYPSRIIVGYVNEKVKEYAETFASLLKNAALKQDVDVRIMKATEAEAVKLFANTYLALRVSFFNELDTYAAVRGLDSRAIIE
ncbi:MAG: nucleotide sugar dehydrogenase, partial [Clostridia bacterium]|nr:nucleotide sugar dehydrogenase [Clostridia bacterium]